MSRRRFFARFIVLVAETVEHEIARRHVPARPESGVKNNHGATDECKAQRLPVDIATNECYRSALVGIQVWIVSRGVVYE